MGVAFCESGAPEDHRDVWTEISWLRSQALYREQHKIVCRHFLFCCITYHVGLRTSCKDISCSFLISSTLAEMMGVPKSPSSTSKSPISPRCLQHPAAGCGRGCGYWACPAKRWPPSCWLGWCMKLWMGWRLRQVDGCRHLHFLLEDSDDVWWDYRFPVTKHGFRQFNSLRIHMEFESFALGSSPEWQPMSVFTHRRVHAVQAAQWSVMSQMTPVTIKWS